MFGFGESKEQAPHQENAGAQQPAPESQQAGANPLPPIEGGMVAPAQPATQEATPAPVVTPTPEVSATPALGAAAPEAPASTPDVSLGLRLNPVAETPATKTPDATAAPAPADHAEETEEWEPIRRPDISPEEMKRTSQRIVDILMGSQEVKTVLEETVGRSLLETLGGQPSGSENRFKSEAMGNYVNEQVGSTPTADSVAEAYKPDTLGKTDLSGLASGNSEPNTGGSTGTPGTGGPIV